MKNADIEKLAHDLTLKTYTNEGGEFIKSTIGADDFKQGIICGYKKALQNEIDKLKHLLIWVDGELKNYRMVLEETESEIILNEVKDKILFLINSPNS